MTTSNTTLTDPMRHEFAPGLNRIAFDSAGTTVVGDLYLPATKKKGVRLPAVLVGGSITTVKEQMSGLYARRLAEKGFATLAFDHRHWGQSGGEPRQLESPADKTADFKNALTFVEALPMIDPDRIGGLGICATASYMGRAVSEDRRFKSFATVAGWFQHPDSTPLFYGGNEGVRRRIESGIAAQERYEETGEMEFVPAYDPKDPDAAMFFELDYYGNPKRGAVPQWKNQWAVASWPEWLRLNAIDGVAEKILAPAMFVHSDGAALPDNVRRFHDMTSGPKSLRWLPDGNQIDFYDQEPYVSRSVDEVAGHFRTSLGG